MKGETCIKGATVLSFTALILLVFAHVGQINTSKVPRGIALVSVNTSALGTGLLAATGDPVPDLYNNNASAPLETQQGLRQLYSWGLYAHCAYDESGQGTCSNGTFGNKFAPLDSILADVSDFYTPRTRFFVTRQNTTFTNSSFLEATSTASFYLIFIASLFTLLAMLSGIPKSSATFIAASVFSLLGAIMLLVAASIWTAIIQQIQAINRAQAQIGVPLGIQVSFGAGLWLLWAAFIALFLSLLPYFVSCHTYRRRFDP